MHVVSDHEVAPSEALDLQCPPLPQTLLRAVELTQQPGGPELEQVTELVQHDPAAVARLLRVVNSASFGQRREITSVPRAILVMGPTSALVTIMSMSILETRTKLSAEMAAPFTRFVRHSIATAFLARHLLMRDPNNFSNDLAGQRHLCEAYTAGILHDLGKLAHLYNFPQAALPFYENPGQEVVDAAGAWVLRREEEKGIFGYDHVQLGLMVAERLCLPEVVFAAVAFHHDHERIAGQPHDRKAALYTVAAANKAAAALGYAFDRGASWRACEADPIWEQMTEERVVGYDSPDVMQQEILAVREELDAYVDVIS